jgi:cell division protein ZapA
VSDRRHVVRVTILGEEYSIRSDESPEHTRAVAQYVDRAIRRVMNSGTVVETQKGAILAALQITDELFKARGSSESLAESIQALSDEVRRWLPPAKRGDRAERGVAEGGADAVAGESGSGSPP